MNMEIKENLTSMATAAAEAETNRSHPQTEQPNAAPAVPAAQMQNGKTTTRQTGANDDDPAKDEPQAARHLSATFEAAAQPFGNSSQDEPAAGRLMPGAAATLERGGAIYLELLGELPCECWSQMNLTASLTYCSVSLSTITPDAAVKDAIAYQVRRLFAERKP